MTISTATDEPPITEPAPIVALCDRLSEVLATLETGHDKRRQRRYVFPHLVYLTPVAEDGQTPSGETVLAAGKHLSEGGIGFYHSQPLSDRRVIATLELPHGERPSFLLELRWCRFIRHGWYESGGRFLRTTATPESCAAAG